MIISASRRTDIPSYYSDWFIHRIKAGEVCVRNPMNARQISRITLSPSVVDCIVFWTKNPIPMLGRINEISEYPYYFQYTINAYGTDIEPALPEIQERIDAIHRIADHKTVVVWRYDPVFLSEKYSLEFHAERFDWLSSQLRGYTRHCTFSFLDNYSTIQSRIKPLNIKPPDQESEVRIAAAFSDICKSKGIQLQTCAESIDLSKYGIAHARCIDDRLIETIIGCPLDVKKDKNQRSECGCAASIDIGLYNTCTNRCVYCYANHSSSLIQKNRKGYDPHSPILCDTITDEEQTNMKNRECKSIKRGQISMF